MAVLLLLLTHGRHFQKAFVCSQQSYAGPDAADTSASLGNGFQFVREAAASQEGSFDLQKSGCSAVNKLQYAACSAYIIAMHGMDGDTFITKLAYSNHLERDSGTSCHCGN